MSAGNHVIIDTTSTPVIPKDIDSAKVKQTLDLALKVADGFKNIINNDVFNRLVEFMHKFATEDWFVELLTYLLNQFGKTGKAPTEAELVTAVAAFRAARGV